MGKQNPQATTYKMAINNQQLANLTEGLKMFIKSSHQLNAIYDQQDISYCDPVDLLEMLIEIKAEKDNTIMHGLCL